MDKVYTFYQTYKIPVYFGFVGFSLFFIAVLLSTHSLKGQSQQDNLSVVSEQAADDNENETIVVDIEGAVVQPGVYELPKTYRIAQAIKEAGGFLSTVDAHWVEKNLNQAQKLQDGMKLYIPYQGEEVQEKILDNTNGGSIYNQININTSSVETLKSLSGIGDKRAASIIEHRPYTSIDELVSEKILPESVFNEIKDKLSVN